MQKSAKSRYDEHLLLWTQMLRIFLGWSDTQVANWALQYNDDISDENSMFYNRTPEWYVANMVMPIDLRQKVSANEFYSLIREIEAAFSVPLEKSTNLDDIDWKPVRPVVDRLLHVHGYSLDSVAKEKSDWHLE